MINRGDVFAERVGREKAQKREQCLEAAEPQCGLDDVDRRTRVTVNPFPIETAKASMATDTEISSISIIAGT